MSNIGKSGVRVEMIFQQKRLKGFGEVPSDDGEERSEVRKKIVTNHANEYSLERKRQRLKERKKYLY